MKYRIKIISNQKEYIGKSVFNRAKNELNIDEDFPSLSESEMQTSYCDGEMEVRDNKAFLRYDECAESGMEGTKTTLSFNLDNPNEIDFKRIGSVSTCLVFSPGKRHICVYNTDQMPFEIGIYSKSVDNRLLGDGVLELTYIVELKGTCAQVTSLRMEIQRNE